MNFSPIAEPDLSLLGDAATRILSIAPVSMAPFASSTLLEVSYLDGAELRQCYLVYETDSETYVTSLSDYLGGVDMVEITSVDVTWGADGGVTYALAYIDRTESSYLSTMTGNRIAIVQNGQLLHQDLVEQTTGQIANTGVENLLINGQGSEIAFTTAANNLIDLDTNDLADVYRISLTESTIERVSQLTEEDEGSEPSRLLSISTTAGQSNILFESAATEFSLDDSNELNDLYLATLGGESQLQLLSHTTDGEASSVVEGEAIMTDGTLLFVSDSDELTAGDSNQSRDIFLQDLDSGTRERLTAGLDLQLGSYNSVDYQLLDLDNTISQLMFSSNYTTLSSDDSLYQIYIMDLETNNIELLSKTAGGDAGNDSSVVGIMDGAGSNYAYQTEATNLVESPGTVLTTNIQPDLQLFDASQRGMTNLSLDLWNDGASLNKSVSVEDSSLIVSESVSFDEIRIDPPAAYQQDINISDAIDVLRHIVGLASLDSGSASNHAADVNNDGNINISDAIDILRHIVGLDTIDDYDLIDSQGSRITQLDPASPGDVPTWTIIANGDVNLSGSFAEEYTIQSDLI